MSDVFSGYNNTILTASGGMVSFNPVDVSEVKLRDVALGAARETRFNGQYRETVPFYSVAEHCVWASYIAPAGSRLSALVHDAAEAFIKDITKPLKLLLHDYAVIENKVEDALRSHFGWPDWHTPAVKLVDKQMLLAEQAAMMNFGRRKPRDYPDLEPANIKFNYWLPSMAWVVWEDRYKELKSRGE
jgi:hypothetical protein